MTPKVSGAALFSSPAGLTADEPPVLQDDWQNVLEQFEPESAPGARVPAASAAPPAAEAPFDCLASTPLSRDDLFSAAAFRPRDIEKPLDGSPRDEAVHEAIETLRIVRAATAQADVQRPEQAAASVRRSRSAKIRLLGIGVVVVCGGGYLASVSVRRPPSASAPASSSAVVEAGTPARPEPSAPRQNEPAVPSSLTGSASTPSAMETAALPATGGLEAMEGVRNVGTPPATGMPVSGAARDGRLSVDSHPVDADVYIDGELVGKTPILVPHIGDGTHSIRLELGGHRGWSSSVRVVPGDQNRVTASLEEEDQPAAEAPSPLR